MVGIISLHQGGHNCNAHALCRCCISVGDRANKNAVLLTNLWSRADLTWREMQKISNDNLCPDQRIPLEVLQDHRWVDVWTGAIPGKKVTVALEFFGSGLLQV
eukprot:11051338-Ditylum_brightwellii.AAC.1